MRRHEKSVTSPEAIEAIIRECRVCRLGLCDDGRPYVVPVCFGYESGTVYVHSAREGMKIDIVRRNPAVCVEFDITGDVIPAAGACGYGMHYRSVIGFGTARFVEDPSEKNAALSAIMRQYTGRRQWVFGEREISGVAVLAIHLDQVSGKAA